MSGIPTLCVAAALIASGSWTTIGTSKLRLPDPSRRIEFTNAQCNGSVLAVSSKSITILPSDRSLARVVYRSNKEAFAFVRVFLHKTNHFRTFIASPVLASGSYPIGGFTVPSHTYRLSDVKVGDRIQLTYSRSNGVDYCDEICITRRPDGRVPPAPGEPLGQRFRHHDAMNLAQDREAQGLLATGQHPPQLICPGLYVNASEMLFIDSGGSWYVRLLAVPEGEYWPDQAHDKK